LTDEIEHAPLMVVRWI